ncbi:MAG: thermonuclease family protein [Chitinispirillales bacterium]|nr:thermonuclease family protein [Chitinispirillales bacterium]
MKTTHKIINGDCRNMRELEDKSVNLIITSPPYWQLKDYGIQNQIGFHDSYENYINNLNFVWKECFRVLCDFDKEIKNLPYVFVDSHKLDKKIDVKKLQYGSKIDKESKTVQKYFSVKEIISPEILKLNNDLTVRLIGIKQNPKVNGSATKFLKEKLKGKRVFLKYDNAKYDKDNNLMVYLYLENKPFINAHLLKNGLALIDESIEFEQKNKFRALI